MKYIILTQRQNQKLFIIISRALISLCREQKVKRNRRVRQFEQNCRWFQKVWNTDGDEFVNFPETVDQMLTAILQMEDQ